ncbi:MAG: flagellar hook-length control protein FliK [Melioribacter sp.]|nr:flagellar hook-length control protein FliK [Melioribacter sp.]
MNFNPLFFDKTFLIENKNFLSSSGNSNKNYLFSDIIKICEEELDSNQSNINSTEKEILLDINDLKNLTITKSNKETVEGIQQAIELLENIALISNSSSVNVNSAHITSKIFILDNENLELFFNKINESLKQKDFSKTNDSQDSNIVYLNEKEIKNKQTNSFGSSEYDFIGFNPEAIIKSIDNKDIFNVTLKTNGEKLTLTISSTDPSNENKNKFNKKLLGNKSQNDFIASNKYQNYDVVLNNFYELDKTKVNEYAEQNTTIENQLDTNSEVKYYKLEVIHTSFENNNFIYAPSKDVKAYTFNENLSLEKNSDTQTKVFISNDEVDSSKIAGVINPVERSEANEKSNQVQFNKTYDESNNVINLEKYDSANGLNQIKENKNIVDEYSYAQQKDIKKEFEQSSNNSIHLFNKVNPLKESSFIPSTSSEIDFRLLTGGKFSKVRVIKDAAEQDIKKFNPEVIDNKSADVNKKDFTQVKNEFAANEFESKINELNVESIKIEVKNAGQKGDIKTSGNFKSQSYSNEVYNNQNASSESSEQIKETQPEKLIESFSKVSLKSFINENKKNQTSDVSDKTKSINTSKLDENNKVDVNTNQINLTHKPGLNENVDSQSLRINEIKVNQTYSSNETNFSKGSKDEKGTKKTLQQAESIAEDFEKNISKSEQMVTKELSKNIQASTHENSSSKIELTDNQINTLKSKIQNEFGNLKETIKVINANQIGEELSKYINSGNKQSITFQLSPENLGKLTLSIDFIENQLRANIEVENEQVKLLIQNNIEQLKNSLQSSGIQLNDVNVSLGNYEQKSLRNSNIKKKSYSKSYSKEIKVENPKAPSTKKLMGYNTYDYLI